MLSPYDGHSCPSPAVLSAGCHWLFQCSHDVLTFNGTGEASATVAPGEDGDMELDSGFSDRLDAIAWFDQCGREGPVHCAFATRRLDSWEEVDVTYDDAWEAMRNQMNGNLTAGLSVSCREVSRSWNELVREGQSLLRVRFPMATNDFWSENDLDPFFGQATARDVNLAWLEATYLRSNCNVESFFLELFKVYEAGHFPCGWEGDYPTGTLLYY